MSSSTTTAGRTYLAFDYGEKYIGVAVGSRHSRLAELSPDDSVAP